MAMPIVDPSTEEKAPADSDDNTLTVSVLGTPRSIRWCRDAPTMGAFDANVVYAECILNLQPPMNHAAFEKIKRNGTPVILYGPHAMICGNELVAADSTVTGWLADWRCNVVHQFTRGDVTLHMEHREEFKEVTHLHYQWVMLTPSKLPVAYTPFVSLISGWRYSMFRGVMKLVESQIVHKPETLQAQRLALSVYLAPVRPDAVYMDIVGQIVTKLQGWDLRLLVEVATPDASFRGQLEAAIRNTEGSALPLVTKENELWASGQAITPASLQLIRSQGSTEHKAEMAKQKKLEQTLQRERTKEAEKALKGIGEEKGEKAARSHLKSSSEQYMQSLLSTSIAPPNKTNAAADTSAAPATTTPPAKGTGKRPVSETGTAPEGAAKKGRKVGLSAPPAPVSVAQTMQGALDAVAAPETPIVRGRQRSSQKK